MQLIDKADCESRRPGRRHSICGVFPIVSPSFSGFSGDSAGCRVPQVSILRPGKAIQSTRHHDLSFFRMTQDRSAIIRYQPCGDSSASSASETLRGAKLTGDSSEPKILTESNFRICVIYRRQTTTNLVEVSREALHSAAHMFHVEHSNHCVPRGTLGMPA